MTDEIKKNDININITYIGPRIKHIRNLLKLSQKDFAAILNTSQANISYLETVSRNTDITIRAYIYFITKGINIEWIIMPDNSNISLFKSEVEI